MADEAPLNVYDALAAMMDQLAGIAWQKLGLQPDMLTGTLHADYPQAKIAIDEVAHLSAIVEPQLDDEDRRRVQSLVRDLRLNYVEKVREANG